MGAFTRSRSDRVAGPANLRAGLEPDKPDAAQTPSLCGLSVSMYCVATCTRIWICRCQTTVLNTSVCMKPTAGSCNAGTCEKLHNRSRIRLRQKAGVCASALKWASAELWFYERVYRPVWPTHSALCDQTYDVQRRKNHRALGKASKWALCPKLSCSYQMSGAWHIRISRLKGKWLRSILLLSLYFDKFR